MITNTAHAGGHAVHTAVSITTLDPWLASVMEPRASSPSARLRTIRELASAGLPVRVMTAPIIPGLNDHEIPSILAAAREAGATAAGYVLLRLPHGLKELFFEWLRRELPDRAGKVESLLRQSRGGRLYDAEFGRRGRGTGPVAEQIGQLFRLSARRLGLLGQREPLAARPIRKPAAASPAEPPDRSGRPRSPRARAAQPAPQAEPTLFDSS